MSNKKLNKKNSKNQEKEPIVLKNWKDYILPKDVHPLLLAQLQNVEEAIMKFKNRGQKLEQQINMITQEIQNNNNDLMINFAIQRQLQMQLGIDKEQKGNKK